MKILAFETSCDETAVSIVENGKEILANHVASQIKWHQQFGGVVPEMASRMHVEKIHQLVDAVFQESKLNWKDLDAVAATYGPGLEGALLVGLSVAKTIASIHQIPLIAVNHLHGHIYANYLMDTPPQFPYITLIASGGHTLLVYAKDHFQFQQLGATRDDACGEAFDKVARVLGLGYPGGPAIEAISKEGSQFAFKFPRAMIKEGLEFSFSGLKTAVIQSVKSIEKKGEEIPVSDISASFQACVTEILATKCIRACKEKGVHQLVLSGGVTANQFIVSMIRKEAEENNIQISIPPMHLCTDNAAMIGAAAWYQYQQFGKSDANILAKSNLSVSEMSSNGY